VKSFGQDKLGKGRLHRGTHRVWGCILLLLLVKIFKALFGQGKAAGGKAAKGARQGRGKAAKAAAEAKAKAIEKAKKAKEAQKKAAEKAKKG
jgi:hypothetical protein